MYECLYKCSICKILSNHCRHVFIKLYCHDVMSSVERHEVVVLRSHCVFSLSVHAAVVYR